MQRFFFLFTVLFLGAGVGDAMAQCARGPRVMDVQAALENKLVCAAGYGSTDTWSEEHGPLSVGGTGPGSLTEYAKGPGHPVDPSKVVGTWAVANNNTPNAVVTYNYTGGSSFTWSLALSEAGSTTGYFFCNGATPIASASITSGPPPCTARR